MSEVCSDIETEDPVIKGESYQRKIVEKYHHIYILIT
jgi:hypothetical protein